MAAIFDFQIVKTKQKNTQAQKYTSFVTVNDHSGHIQVKFAVKWYCDFKSD